MKTLLGWGIAAVGGYFLLQHFGIDFGGTAVASGTSDSPQANDTTAANTLNSMKTMMNGNGEWPNNSLQASYQSVDTWNSYYHSIRNIAGPAPEDLFPNVDRNKQYSLAEYWTAMTKKGFSGMGVIAHKVNPYWNNQGTPYGSNLLPNGFETYVVRKGA